MIKRVITAKEGEKTLSIQYNPISRAWGITKRQGKSLCVISSENCLIKAEEYTDKKKKQEQLKAYARERFSNSRYDIRFTEDRVYLALCRNCEACESIELEPFALARLFGLYKRDGFVIDWGRRKTVFVEVVDGLLRSFRVVLKGGDYISQRISQRRSLSFEDAERLKKEKGSDLEEVKDAVEEILYLCGYEFSQRSVLLTGGGSKLRGIREFFSEVVPLRECDPEYAVCLGACLRGVFKNPYPDFSQDISPKDIKRLLYTSSALAALFLTSLFFMERVYPVDGLRAVQRAEFKRLFPQEPIVSLRDQVRAKVSAGEDYKLTKLLLMAKDSLRVGMKLYSFEYSDGKLLIRGEAHESQLEGIKLRSTKEISPGRREFEIVVP
ncbi:MAG: cell division FtsA domain-containing protein [Aquificaceae bacterium]